MATCTTTLEGNNTYAVAIVRANGDLGSEKERIVVGDALNKKASCSCGQFKRTGVLLCVHALMNIKLLPDHYIMKRWTREARFGAIKDNQGRNIIENPKLDAMLQYRFMSHKFVSMAYQAASYPECCLLVDNALDCLGNQIEEQITAARLKENSDRISSESNSVQPNEQRDEDLLSAARLKKKRSPTKKFKAT
ncbi:hypothetical protein BS78_01G212100 [Paspalum vaginatum]|nr:hypothetical protein BS78_01G212100 [Paspalum vaginatum]